MGDKMRTEEVIKGLKVIKEKLKRIDAVYNFAIDLEDFQALTEAIRLIEAGKKGLNNEPTAHSIA
jgi:hypothetical protein